MRGQAAPARRLSAGVAAVLAAAAVAGIVVPPVPLAYRGAWSVVFLVSSLWLGALYVFFEHFAGPGLLAHLALSFVAVIGLLMPRRLALLETRLRSLVGMGPPQPPTAG